jgi:hypothetical protein
MTAEQSTPGREKEAMDESLVEVTAAAAVDVPPHDVHRLSVEKKTEDMVQVTLNDNRESLGLTLILVDGAAATLLDELERVVDDG